jgi:hypothetical protein
LIFSPQNIFYNTLRQFPAERYPEEITAAKA